MCPHHSFLNVQDDFSFERILFEVGFEAQSIQALMRDIEAKELVVHTNHFAQPLL
jgi:hypothetical protein